MLPKNEIKFINALKQKKFREEHGLFIAEGAKIVPELLHSRISVKQVYATAAFIDAQRPDNNQTEFIRVTAAELERISGLVAPNEALAVCSIPETVPDPEAIAGELVLVLDDIRDPGNLGTIIRIADWFGISTVICSETTVDAYNPKVVQATMGSIARVGIHYTGLTGFLKAHPQPVFGALLDGVNIYSRQLPATGFIVIGNESKGISEAVQELVTDRISIPSFSHSRPVGGEAESLNAAIATSVICSEFRRRVFAS